MIRKLTQLLFDAMVYADNEGIKVYKNDIEMYLRNNIARDIQSLKDFADFEDDYTFQQLVNQQFGSLIQDSYLTNKKLVEGMVYTQLHGLDEDEIPSENYPSLICLLNRGEGSRNKLYQIVVDLIACMVKGDSEYSKYEYKYLSLFGFNKNYEISSMEQCLSMLNYLAMLLQIFEGKNNLRKNFKELFKRNIYMNKRLLDGKKKMIAIEKKIKNDLYEIYREIKKEKLRVALADPKLSSMLTNIILNNTFNPDKKMSEIGKLLEKGVK